MKHEEKHEFLLTRMRKSKMNNYLKKRKLNKRKVIKANRQQLLLSKLKLVDYTILKNVEVNNVLK